MRKLGGHVLVSVAILACTACLGDSGKLEIRAADSGLKAGDAPVPFRIAEARAHLALGNVALALEGFRKAVREDPASVDGQAGIAQSYDRMGRFDLSRRHYEAALAMAPRDSALLALFASSLDAQGRVAEAASVRREIAALAAAEAAVPSAEGSAPVEQAAAQGLAPPPMAAPVGPSVTIALPPLRAADSGPAQAADDRSQALRVAPVGQSVTIALPPPRPAPGAMPAKKAEIAGPTPRRAARLERLSLTEVALITSDGPRWTRPAARPQRAAQSIDVRILNAARVDKLAARTRSYLSGYGWKSIVIGDAASVRARSLIVYPRGAQAAASRLSARLGFAMAPRHDVRQLTVLLGRDAAARRALQPGA